MTNQALRKQERPSGEHRVGEMMQKCARFKKAAEGIRGLVAEDRMRRHPAVNEKLVDAIMAVNEYALMQGIGSDESGGDGYRGPDKERETTRIRTMVNYDDGSGMSICTNIFVKEQCGSDVPAVSIMLYEPVKLPDIKGTVMDHAVSIRNPGYGNAVDYKPERVLDRLVQFVEKLARCQDS